MKKTLLAILMTICIAAGLSACGEDGQKNSDNDGAKETQNVTKEIEEHGGESATVEKDHKFAEVTIEGNKYNLSQDFEDVIKDLTGNGIQVGKFLVGSSLKPYVYNEDCKVITGEKVSDIQLYADYAPVSQYKVSGIQPLEDSGDMVIKIFELWQWVAYETASGIKTDSVKEDIESIDGYVKMDAVSVPDQTTYGALYIEGELVDLSEYEDEFEEWKICLNENGFAKAMEKYLPNQRYYHYSSRIWSDRLETSGDYDVFEKECERFGVPLKNVMLTNFAMHDAGEKLEAGEIESYTLLRYEARYDDGIYMKYLEYSIDEDWNEEDYQ